MHSCVFSPLLMYREIHHLVLVQLSQTSYGLHLQEEADRHQTPELLHVSFKDDLTTFFSVRIILVVILRAPHPPPVFSMMTITDNSKCE